jgi:hypothetical protein
LRRYLPTDTFLSRPDQLATSSDADAGIRLVPSSLRIIFALYSPILVLMATPNARRRVYMSFQDGQGWQCHFLEADLQTPIPKRLHFASSANLVELVERGGGIIDQEARLMLEQGISMGRGGVFLNLTEEQYAKLRK